MGIEDPDRLKQIEERLGQADRDVNTVVSIGRLAFSVVIVVLAVASIAASFLFGMAIFSAQKETQNAENLASVRTIAERLERDLASAPEKLAALIADLERVKTELQEARQEIDGLASTSVNLKESTGQLTNIINRFETSNRLMQSLEEDLEKNRFRGL
jgi:hypothetical protein